MSEFLRDSAFFGVFISLLFYFIGLRLKKRFGFALLNPLLVSVVLTIAALLALDVDYQSYNAGGRYLSYLLTPVTVRLAIPLYEQLSLLRKNWKAILTGIFAGSMAGMGCIFLLALAFGLDHAQYVTLLPKSVTTAIGLAVSEELGGYPAITAVVIVTTGLMGNIFAEGFLRLIRVREPIAKGVAIGTSAHAIGTSKAMEIGEVEGAMSSLSIAVAGLFTVAGASVFAMFI